MSRSYRRPVVLVTPPVGDSTMPMLGPHVLSGHLKTKGVECRVYDASIELLWLAASPENLRSIAQSEGEQVDNHLANLVEPTLAAMKRCKDRQLVLVAGLKLFSLFHEGFQLSADDLSFPFSVSTLAELSMAISIAKPLTRLLEKTQFFTEVSAIQDLVIGISVAFPSQLILTVAMCQSIKRRCPDSTLVLGGSFFGSSGFKAEDLLQAFNCIDVIVIGSGEVPLEELAKGVPMERLRGATPSGGGYTINAAEAEPTIPDFSTVDWSGYTSGPRTVPFSFHTLCYYGRCRFCSGDKELAFSLDQHYDLEIAPLQTAVENHGIECIYIVDAAVSPHGLRKIASELNGRILWAANARPERVLAETNLLQKLNDSGCWMLRFGFESGSQRILDTMAKGTRIEHVSRVIKEMAAANIKSHLYIMLGYPGEEDTDREQTIDFLRVHRNYIYSYSISIFRPIPGTAVYQELCLALGLDPEELTLAISHINAHLFPNEEKYRRLTESVERITSVLHGASRTNRLCYSGRVFPAPGSHDLDTDRIAPICLTTESSGATRWNDHFSSIISIIPVEPVVKPHCFAFVDLINDEVVVGDVEEGSGDEKIIGSRVEEYFSHRNIRLLGNNLPSSHVALQSDGSTGSDNVILYTSTMDWMADGQTY